MEWIQSLISIIIWIRDYKLIVMTSHEINRWFLFFACFLCLFDNQIWCFFVNFLCFWLFTNLWINKFPWVAKHTNIWLRNSQKNCRYQIKKCHPKPVSHERNQIPVDRFTKSMEIYRKFEKEYNNISNTFETQPIRRFQI